MLNKLKNFRSLWPDAPQESLCPKGNQANASPMVMRFYHLSSNEGGLKHTSVKCNLVCMASNITRTYNIRFMITLSGEVGYDNSLL